MSGATHESVSVVPAPPQFQGWLVCAIWRRLHLSGDVASVVPANVYACLNVVSAGAIRVPGAGPLPLPPMFLAGPFTVPMRTLASTPLRSLSLVIQPWLLEPWFGHAASALVDSIASAASAPVLAGETVELLQAGVDEPRLVQRALALMADALPAAPPVGVIDMQHALLRRGTVSGAAAAFGWSERHFARHFRCHHGLSPRTWLRVKRFERALLRLTGAGTPLAHVAADAGYADQAHMTRDFRRILGESPAGTRQAMESDSGGSWALEPSRDERLRMRLGDPTDAPATLPAKKPSDR